MQVLLIGSGAVSSALQLRLSESGFTIAASLSAANPQMLEFFDYRALLVVAPEAAVSPDTLRTATGLGKLLFLIAGESDGLAAWANGSGIPTYAYPPTGVETDRLLAELRRAETGGRGADDQFRRSLLGSEASARLQSGMAVRKIAVTSPKGGTGKTTTAVNLAVALALSGVSTYLVDADANAGALQYHLRMTWARSTLLGLLRREAAAPRAAEPLDRIAAGAKFLDAFTEIEKLPTLKVLPGVVTGELSDAALQDEDVIGRVIEGVFDAGVGANGVVVMDVGINPAHPLHRAALRAAEGIAIVIKPEIPDVAEVKHWLDRMVGALAGRVGREAAYEFIGSRVKLCYNMVVAGGFKSIHGLLNRELAAGDVALKLTPNGVLPVVEPHAAIQSVNSARAEDIFAWRYRREKPEELQAYTEALLDFACHFVPLARESAYRTGLLSPRGPKLGFLRRLFT
ncbi:MAG TPA: AAA family ATPase [Anaerolineales bacterium]|nr:AAA family ATPase [Anaerolineales bacterium]